MNATAKTINKGLHKASGVTQSVSSTAWCLLRLNLLFIMCCIPVITAPAATAAMIKVLMKIIEGDNPHLWRVFWSEFRADFFKALEAGLILALAAAVVVCIGYIVMQLGGFIGALGIAFVIVFGLWLYVTSCYLFVLIVTVDLPLLSCLRNAALLALIEAKRNVLLLIPLILLTVCALLFPISLPLLLFVMFSLCQFMVCTIVYKAIRRRVIVSK